ncbi:MAG: hypothetical protein WD960_10995 [Gemmatimonadota bacterium]
MNRTSFRRLSAVLTLALLLPLAACDDSDPAGPDLVDVEAVAGTYLMTDLQFDPQGTLPNQELLDALGTTDVELILTLNRSAQIVYRDPVSDLVVTLPGNFQSTVDGIRLQWNSGSNFRDLLLSSSMEFEFDSSAGTLRFDDAAPNGVPRARLIALVPAFEEEQLLDPTPGRLQVTFTRDD